MLIFNILNYHHLPHSHLFPFFQVLILILANVTIVMKVKPEFNPDFSSKLNQKFLHLLSILERYLVKYLF